MSLDGSPPKVASSPPTALSLGEQSVNLSSAESSAASEATSVSLETSLGVSHLSLASAAVPLSSVQPADCKIPAPSQVLDPSSSAASPVPISASTSLVSVPSAASSVSVSTSTSPVSPVPVSPVPVSPVPVSPVPVSASPLPTDEADETGAEENLNGISPPPYSNQALDSSVPPGHSSSLSVQSSSLLARPSPSPSLIQPSLASAMPASVRPLQVQSTKRALWPAFIAIAFAISAWLFALSGSDKPCPQGQYESSKASIFANKVCTPLTICDLSAQYILQEATVSSNRVCEPITTCAVSTEYIAKEATESSNRVCAPLPELKEVREHVENGEFSAVLVLLNTTSTPKAVALSARLPHFINSQLRMRLKRINNTLDEWHKDSYVLPEREWFTNLFYEFPKCQKIIDEETRNMLADWCVRIQTNFNSESQSFATLISTPLVNVSDLYFEHTKTLLNVTKNVGFLFSASPCECLSSFSDLKTNLATKYLQEASDFQSKCSLKRGEFGLSMKEQDGFVALLFKHLRNLQTMFGLGLKGVLPQTQFLQNVVTNAASALRVQIQVEQMKINRAAVDKIKFYVNVLEMFENRSMPGELMLGDLQDIMKKVQAEKIDVLLKGFQLASGEKPQAKAQADYLIKLYLFHHAFPKLRILDSIAHELNETATLHSHTQISAIADALNARTDDEGVGTEMFHELAVFANARTAVRKERVAKQDVDHVLKYLSGTELQDDGTWTQKKSFDKLKKFYAEFKELYDALIDRAAADNTLSDHNLTALAIRDLQNHLTQCSQFDLKNVKLEWSSHQKNCVPKVVAYVFAIWSYLSVQNTTQDRAFMMQPDNAQVIAVFSLLNIDQSGSEWTNNLAQIGTGEGKSVTLAVTAATLSLLGADVYIACYSEYLTNRDHTAFSKVFQTLNTPVRYETFESLTEVIIEQLGPVRSLVTGFLNGQDRVPCSGMLNLPRPQILLVDEVDIFLKSDFFGEAYRPGIAHKSEAFEKLAYKMWSERESDLQLPYVMAWSEYENVRSWLGAFSPRLEHIARSMLSDLKNFSSPTYHVKDDQIGYLKLDGIDYNSTRGFKKTWAYFAEREKAPAVFTSDVVNANVFLPVTCGVFSYASLPTNRFHAMAGVSGTLGATHPELKAVLVEQFDIRALTYVPSVFGPRNDRMTFHPTRIVSEASFHNEIVTEITLRRKSGGFDTIRPVLVIFEDATELKKFWFSGPFSHLQENAKMLTEDSNEEERLAAVRRTSAGLITLLTRAFGRGSDFVVYDRQVIDHEGLHVLQTFYSIDSSEEEQIKGRTARQNGKGSYSLVLKIESLARDLGMTIAEVENLKDKGFSDALSVKRKALHLAKISSMEAKASKLTTLDQLSITTQRELCTLPAGEPGLELFDNLIKLNSENLQQGTGQFVPYHIILALDGSGSMFEGLPEGISKWEGVQNAVQKMLNMRRSSAPGAEDLVSVLVYDRAITTEIALKPIKESFTFDLGGGGTAFAEPIARAKELFNQSDPAKKYVPALFFLSDGEAESGKEGFAEMESLCKTFESVGLLVFTESFGDSTAGQETLKKLSKYAGRNGFARKSGDGITLQANFAEFIQMINPVTIK